jgi:hypothetical protein
MVTSKREEVDLHFQLSAPEVRLSVEVRLRGGDGRWVAVATTRGSAEIGLGATPRAALTASLASVGKHGLAALLVDPRLFAVSAALPRTA